MTHPYAQALQWVIEGKLEKIEVRKRDIQPPSTWWNLGSKDYDYSRLIAGLPGYEFRIRKPMKIVNGIAVPMHETQAPAYGADYYVPAPYRETSYVDWRWRSASCDLLALERGLVYLIPEDAAECGKAMEKWEIKE